jgi:hypothetical protein
MEKKLPNPLDDPQLPNPLNEPELPKPDEKLLRPPTLSEKYGWLKPIILIAIAVICIDLGIVSILHSESQPNNLASKQNQIVPYHPPQTTITSTILQWKTYTNHPGQFSLKYPTAYTLAENPQSLPNSIVITSNTIENINTNFKITIQYHPIPKPQTLSQLIDQNKICPTIDSQGGIAATFNQTTNGKLYKDVPCQQSFKTIFFSQNNNLLYIITIDSQEKFDTIKTYTDQIFSTFKFLN